MVETIKFSHIYVLIIFIFLTMVATALSVPSYAKRGCIDKCGNVTIPYPFGIGAKYCSLNQWYVVDCNSSTPYLSSASNLEVLAVDLNEQMVLVKVPMTPDSISAPVWNSSQILNLDRGAGSPFLFSDTHNKFIVEGCGTAVISSHGNELSGCSTTCLDQELACSNNKRTSCHGINCCQTNIPYFLETYTVNINQSTVYKSCLSAFLVADNSYLNSLLPDPLSVVRGNSLVLRWTLTDDDNNETSCGSSFNRQKLDTGNGTNVSTTTCSCDPEKEEGNPYLSGGCQATEDCKRCMHMGGICKHILYGGAREFRCYYDITNGRTKSSSSQAVFLGVGISIVVLVLTAICFVSYKNIRRTKNKRRKKTFFERNGGLLLKQQVAGQEGLVDQTRIFTSSELEKATDYFNENRILGRGGQGTVYKGMLTDGRIVAVKKPKAVDGSQLEQFINEVVILSQINHRNVVKLLGCCLETEVPLLVSEFIPNGTLYDHIHDHTSEIVISWNKRLQIATEVAEALSYLHSATSTPIYHRDIKSTNILLDNKYTAKISDFGASRFVSIGQTHLTTLVQGTFGYMDPEYFQSNQFTEKSDVSSFGVVLLELLTRERSVSQTRFGRNKSLVTHFIMGFEEGQVMSILDEKLVREGARNELLEVANLAMRCLNLCGKNRPTMKVVASELEGVRMSHKASMVQSEFKREKYNVGEEELIMLSYGESTSSS